jgi:hypothetical protein
MPVQPRKRGARPSPRSALAAALPYRVHGVTPPRLIMKPARISMWGNDVHHDSVTAEEAFAKACSNPEIFISDDDVINWATNHGVLEGGTITDVMTWMQAGGFTSSSAIYNDGAYYAVDWTNSTALQNAIAQGPVKLGVAGHQLETAWTATHGHSGWFGTGWQPDTSEDFCVTLCGYGAISWLAGELGVAVPAGVDGGQYGYAMFAWGSIGIVDQPSMIAVTHEAWLRQPTTVTEPTVNPTYPTWRVYDLTVLASTPTAKVPPATGNPAGYPYEREQTQHVFFRGTDNHIHELWWKQDVWHTDDATHAATAASDPAGYVDQTTQHVVFRGTGNHVYMAYSNPGGGWHSPVADLTELTKPPAQGPVPVAAGNPAAYLLAANSTHHVMVRGTDSHIHEMWFDGTWHPVGDLTGSSGPAVGSDPATCVVAPDIGYVIFRGQDNRIHALWDQGGWKNLDLTDAINAPSAAGNPAAYVVAADNTLRVLYRGTDSHIRAVYRDNNGWHVDQTITTAGAPAMAGDPAGYGVAEDGTQHVVYRGTDSHIHELMHDSIGWHVTDLTAATSAPVAASDPAGYVYAAQRTQHVVYRGTDNHIYELRWA